MLSALSDLVTELKGREPIVFLLDEIQEIADWSLWARRVNETTNHRLILSGSSSKLSSREIPTELRGQSITIPAFPLNFREFLRFRETDPDTVTRPQLLNLLREHLTIGGMPEIVLAETGLRPLILTNYINTFVDRDIIERYRLRNKEAFSDLLRLLPNTRNFTYSKLANTLNSFGHSIGKATLIRYLHWLESSFFLSRLELYSANVKTRIQSVKKAYRVDNYFSTQFGSTQSESLGHLMEQAVYNRLHVRSAWHPEYQMAYWKDYAGNELDCVVSRNKSVNEVIQVTFANTLAEIPDREVRGLVKAAKQFQLKSGTIITWEVEDRTEKDEIELIFIPIRKWLENDL
jgi:predicted AAA+ superfamily ATPase